MIRHPITRRTLFAALLTAVAIGVPGARAGKRYEPYRQGSWPANLIAEVQRRLLERGFDPGPIDGQQGPRTAAAIRSFQSANAMEPDGQISEALLNALGMGAGG